MVGMLGATIPHSTTCILGLSFMWAYMAQECMKVRGQFVGVSYSAVAFARIKLHVVRLGGKCLYPLSHFTWVFLFSFDCFDLGLGFIGQFGVLIIVSIHDPWSWVPGGGKCWFLRLGGGSVGKTEVFFPQQPHKDRHSSIMSVIWALGKWENLWGSQWERDRSISRMYVSL